MAYTPMFEMWRVIEETTAIDVVLDLGHGEDFPLSDHPWYFAVRIPMTRQNDDGMPGDEEAARLNLVENRVREIVKVRDGLYVGRRTGGGNRDLIFYLPARPRGLEDRIRASVGMELLFISRDDKAWQAYQSMLPGPREWRQIEDRKLIGDLENAETEVDLPHRIVHTVRTSSQKGAEALVRLYEKLELEESSIDGQRPNLLVSGVQVTPLELEPIHRVSWILESKAPKAKGEYLGWEAEPEFGEAEMTPAEREAAEAVLAALQGMGDITGVDDEDDVEPDDSELAALEEEDDE